MQAPEIVLDFEALASNFEQLACAGTSKTLPLFPVVKANAYGLGATLVALELEKRFDSKRMPYVCVARWSEAEQLRQSGFKRNILVLSQYSLVELARSDLEGISLMVGTLGDLEILKKLDLQSRSRICSLHLDLDTGMNRIGFKIAPKGADFEKHSDVLKVLATLNHPIEGISTHLARAEDANEKFSNKQIVKFESHLKSFENSWKDFFPNQEFPQWIHVNNSAGSCRETCSKETARRPGILMWGAHQNSNTRREFENESTIRIKPVLSMRACLRKTMWIEAGEGVSYGHRYVSSQKKLIGMLSVGYADGVSRQLSTDASQSEGSRLKFWIDSFAVPIVGTVTMDMVMVDLSDHPKAQEYAAQVKRGEDVWAYWICKDQPVEAHADALNTITYEVLCDLTARVKRMRQS